MPDDAAVYRLDAERALIVTADFFTPVVDDPYTFGAIAAANALSDVYAMGGEPILAINLVAFPPELPEALREVLRGGAEKLREAGVPLAGGHTVRDKEPKYGLAVVGMAHPDRLLTRAGARVGDVLVLTKPLGSGVIATAGKREQAEVSHLAGAIRWMSALNRTAGSIAVEVGAHAATDITGFGLLGHAWGLAESSGVGLRIKLHDVPLMDGARDYAERGLWPGGSACNRDYYGPNVHFEAEISEAERMLLFDAQTSGGLLVAMPPERADRMLLRLSDAGESGWLVGEVIEQPRIQVAAGKEI